jgi:hypothetical protein
MSRPTRCNEQVIRRGVLGPMLAVEPDLAADVVFGIRAGRYRSDVLLVATPTWLGHMSSVAQRALERLDAELAETDDEGRTARTRSSPI